jgi:hypothetical protein
LEIGDLVPDLFFLLVPLSEDLADQMYEGDRDGGGEKAPLNWRMAFHLPEARVAARAGAGATRVGGDYVGCGVGRLMNVSVSSRILIELTYSILANLMSNGAKGRSERYCPAASSA